MAFLPGRFFSRRDVAFMNGINDELLGNIIQTVVTIFKANAQETSTNIYGESKASVGKTFYPGIDITAYVDRAAIVTDVDDFGPNRKQNVAFRFLEKELENINFFPQTGDLVLFNVRYHEVDDVVQEQFLGGVAEKSLSIIVNTHYTRLSKIDLVERQS